MVIVTKHAEKRLKKRSGLTKKSIQRMAERAFTEGVKHKDTKGALNKWITSLYFKKEVGNNIRLYGDKVFIFSDNKLITVFQIPNNLVKILKEYSK